MHGIAEGEPRLHDQSHRQQHAHVVEQGHIGVPVECPVQKENRKKRRDHQECEQHIPAVLQGDVQRKIADQLVNENQNVLHQRQPPHLLPVLLHQQIKGEDRVGNHDGYDAVFGQSKDISPHE